MANLSKLQADALNNASTYLVNAPVFTGTPLSGVPAVSIYQAQTNVYVLGGRTPSYTNAVLKTPVATDTPTSSAGTLSTAVGFASSSSSTENAYTHAGYTPTRISTIQKYSFSSETTSSNGNFPFTHGYNFGNMSPTHGYSMGGFVPPAGYYSTVWKYPFSAPGGITSVTNLPVGRSRGGGNSQQSETDGYADGGLLGPTGSYSGNIQKITYSSDSMSSQGTYVNGFHSSAGVSSSTDGYSIGGYNPPTYRNYFLKWPFASASPISSLGGFIQPRGYSAGGQTNENGYVMGGYTGPPFVYTNDIFKFPFASETSEADVASLTTPTSFTTGASY